MGSRDRTVLSVKTVWTVRSTSLQVCVSRAVRITVRTVRTVGLAACVCLFEILNYKFSMLIKVYFSIFTQILMFEEMFESENNMKLGR